ncbi:hypothetical protein ABMY26_07420 (plasmid) [Azospirillum sp. HJ39]
MASFTIQCRRRLAVAPGNPDGHKVRIALRKNYGDSLTNAEDNERDKTVKRHEINKYRDA